MLLTLQAVGVQKVLALFVTLDTALHTSHSLSSDAPEKTLALVAIGRRCGGPGDEIVRSGRRYGIDHRLQGFLVHVHLLRVYHRDCIADKSKVSIWQKERGRKEDKSEGRLGKRFTQTFVSFYFGHLFIKVNMLRPSRERNDSPDILSWIVNPLEEWMSPLTLKKSWSPILI